MSGQRLAFVTMIPLSMEKLSFGSPSIVQLRICTGSPSTSTILKSSEQGMLMALHCLIHSSIACCLKPTEKDSEYTFAKAGNQEWICLALKMELQALWVTEYKTSQATVMACAENQRAKCCLLEGLYLPVRGCESTHVCNKT